MNLMGGFFGGYSCASRQLFPLLEEQRGAFSPQELAGRSQQLQRISPTCIHPNCLICEKHAEIVDKQNQKENEKNAKLAKKKKEDYNRRVKEWMKIIRR